MGPLVQAMSRHKFILVLTDYTIRYPEAIPLHNVRVETVAKELVQVFTRTGIPKQVVTDQGASFMSDILQALWCFSGVQPLRTSVYHPQAG